MPLLILFSVSVTGQDGSVCRSSFPYVMFNCHPSGAVPQRWLWGECRTARWRSWPHTVGVRWPGTEAASNPRGVFSKKPSHPVRNRDSKTWLLSLTPQTWWDLSAVGSTTLVSGSRSFSLLSSLCFLLFIFTFWVCLFRAIDVYYSSIGNMADGAMARPFLISSATIMEMTLHFDFGTKLLSTHLWFSSDFYPVFSLYMAYDGLWKPFLLLIRPGMEHLHPSLPVLVSLSTHLRFIESHHFHHVRRSASPPPPNHSAVILIISLLLGCDN